MMEVVGPPETSVHRTKTTQSPPGQPETSRLYSVVHI